MITEYHFYGLRHNTVQKVEQRKQDIIMIKKITKKIALCKFRKSILRHLSYLKMEKFSNHQYFDTFFFCVTPSYR